MTFLKTIKGAWRFLFFFDASTIIRKGLNRPLKEDDSCETPKWLRAKNIPEKFHDLDLTSWKGFLLGVLGCTLPRFWWVIVCIAGLWFFTIANPAVIHAIVSQLSLGIASSNLEEWNYSLVFLVLGFAGLQVGHSLLVQHYFYKIITLEQMIINGLNIRIYSKALGLGRQDLEKRSVGDIVNHMGSDTNAIAFLPVVIGELIWGLGVIATVVVMSYQYLGFAGFAAFVVMAVLMPVCKRVALRLVDCDEEIMRQRDIRVNAMSQILNAIKVIKFLVWEKFSANDIGSIRKKEIQARRKMARVRSFALLLFLGANTLSVVAAFGTYLALGNALDAATVFACLALFSAWEFPFAHLSDHLAMLSEAKVAAQRIIDFLSINTKGSEVSENLQNQLGKDKGAVSESNGEVATGLRLENFSCAYGATEALKNCNLFLEPGSSTAIVGAIGAGKSTLLKAILGEEVTSGEIDWIAANKNTSAKPKIAYVPQLAFIINDTVVRNITFGEEEDEQRVRDALYVSRLHEDVQAMAGGLKTEIGEHGVNLSGGQKQRLSMARAFYQDPGVCLLDDPLSALDEQSAAIVSNRLIFGAWKQKTRIVVTHRFEQLARFDQVVFMVDGRIAGKGKLGHLIAENELFANFYAKARLDPEDSNSNDAAVEIPSSVVKKNGHASGTGASNSSTEGEASGKKSFAITAAEDRETGAVKLEVFLGYVKALATKIVDGKSKFSPSRLLALFGLTFIATLLPVLQNYWLALWNDSSAVESGFWGRVTSFCRENFLGSEAYNFGVFVLIGGGIVAFGFFRYLYWALKGIDAGIWFHDKALKSVLNTKVRFFDANPVGRVLNRFSLDLDAVESQIPWAFEEMIRSTMSALIMLGAVIVIVPFSLIFALPAFAVFYWLQRAYRSAARDLRRLFSITRSPRFAHFKETIEGLVSIRAYEKQDWFWKKFHLTLERNQKVFYSMILTNRWFSVRIPLISAFFCTCAIAYCIFLSRQVALDASYVGLLLLLCMNFSNQLNWAVRSFSEAEARLTSIERLLYYGKLPAEHDFSRNASALPKHWPSNGTIEFDNVQMRYADHLPLVLKGVNFSVVGSQTVGIVGRTGAGKSTILSTLFRFCSLSDGAIYIDGINIADIPLQKLRQSIAIIPQDPILYSGTLRENLDRYEMYSDDQIMLTLSKLNIGYIVTSAADGFETRCTENGSNFSQGQRQLICLARALLSDSKIIVMDEATASMDVDTDERIQSAIRLGFADRTVLIIAHRLKTLEHCDAIIEMEAGKVKTVHQSYEDFRDKLDAERPHALVAAYSNRSNLDQGEILYMK